jgi:hypothetical protein
VWSAIERWTVTPGTILWKASDDMSGGMLPTRMTYTDLANLLLEVHERVQRGDSLEGFIEWALPGTTVEEDDAAIGLDEVDVIARYRFGNLEHGQGFMRIIGTFPTTPTTTTEI